jgi:hypothetical protein
MPERKIQPKDKSTKAVKSEAKKDEAKRETKRVRQLRSTRSSPRI